MAVAASCELARRAYKLNQRVEPFYFGATVLASDFEYISFECSGWSKWPSSVSLPFTICLHISMAGEQRYVL